MKKEKIDDKNGRNEVDEGKEDRKKISFSKKERKA
jgi:hypothetical protein